MTNKAPELIKHLEEELAKHKAIFEKSQKYANGEYDNGYVAGTLYATKIIELMIRSAGIFYR